MDDSVGGPSGTGGTASSSDGTAADGGPSDGGDEGGPSDGGVCASVGGKTAVSRTVVWQKSSP